MHNSYTSTGLVDSMAQQLVIWRLLSAGRLDTILCLLVIAADIRHFHMEFTLAYLQSALQQQHFEKEAMYTYIRWYVLLKGTSTCSTVLTFPQKADADSKVGMEYALELHTKVKMIM